VLFERWLPLLAGGVFLLHDSGLLLVETCLQGGFDSFQTESPPVCRKDFVVQTCGLKGAERKEQDFEDIDWVKEYLECLIRVLFFLAMAEIDSAEHACFGAIPLADFGGDLV